MITFHPTISLKAFLKRLRKPPESAETLIQGLFPNNNTTLTDSGRSALAVAIGALNLRGKRIVVPAFLCDVLAPVLKHYSMESIVVDVDPKTFQPDVSAYTGTFDAALLVATYGKIPDPAIVGSLRERGVVVIEDYAHVPLPHEPLQTISGDARYYSVSKTLPVFDGGVVVLKKGSRVRTFEQPRTTLTSLKDILKVISFLNEQITKTRLSLSRKTPPKPSWSGVASMRPLSKRFLAHALTHRRASISVSQYSYCYPVLVSRPEVAEERLFKAGIIAERLWLHPLSNTLRVAPERVPNTNAIAKRVVCLPLWHLTTIDEKRNYEIKLKDALANYFRGFGEESGRQQSPDSSER